METDRLMNIRTPLRQHGVALPVMLIMLVVMLIGSLYLMRSSHNSTLATSALAYDSALSREADLGILTASKWLSATAAGANKALLEKDSSADGYVATYIPGQAVDSSAFWSGSVKVAGTSVEYVIHRMCSLTGRYDAAGAPPNSCVQTTPNTAITGSGVQLGESLASDAQDVAPPPQIHYVVTARIFGARGGNVVNQAVVMIGA